MTEQVVDEPAHLKRALGFWQVTAGGVGIIIGAGIYVLIGAATAEAGPPVWLAFVLAGVLCALTAMSYAELSSMFPSAGAEYEYTRQAFPEWVAFLVGWAMVAALVVAAATVSLGFARYAGQFFEVNDRIVALGLLGFVGLVAWSGIRQSSLLILGLSTLQVSGLVGLIAIGAGHIGHEPLVGSTSAGGVLGAAALVFFAFIGFDEVITLSEETKDPTRTIPRALLTALAISTLLYVLVAVAAVSVLGAETLGRSERPLADVMAEVAGSRAADVVAVVALISTMNTTLLAVTAGSRLTYGMATAKALPAWLGRINRRTATPTVAIVTVAVIAAGFVAAGRLTLIASLTDFAVYVVFLAVNGTVVVLRWRKPELPRPFRVPGPGRRTPVVAVLGTVATLVMVDQLEGEAVLLGLGMCGLGLAAGMVAPLRRTFRRRQGTPNL